MARKYLLVMGYVFLACLVISPPWDAGAATEEESRTPQEVIARNLAALGGEARLRGIRSLVVTGSVGSALLTGGEEVTLYLKKPAFFKREGLFRVLLHDGEKFVFNNAGTETAIPEQMLQELNYRIGFYHNGFSLLHWEKFFPVAELDDIKRYGPAAYYVLRFPGAENGRDLTAYVDAETFLVDRLVFVVSHPEAREIKIVNRFRDYREFDGLLFPTRLIFDKVGWETSPSHFIIDGVEVNRDLEDGLFESADIDFGTVACEDGVLHGEIRGTMESYILTNIRKEDLSAAGVVEKDRLDLRIGDTRLEARYLDNIQASAKEIRPNEVYLCRYFISGYPRMILMGFGVDVIKDIPCERGDAVVIKKIEDGTGESTDGEEQGHEEQ